MPHAEAGFENQNQNQPTTDAPNNFYESVSNYFTSESFNNTLNSVRESISTTADQFLPGLDLDFGPTGGGTAMSGDMPGNPKGHPQSISQERPLEAQPPRESASSTYASPDKSKSFESITGGQPSAAQSDSDASNKSLPKGDRPEPKSKEVFSRGSESIETTQQRALEGGSESIAHQLAEDGQLTPEALNFLDTVHRQKGREGTAQAIGLINENLAKMGSEYRLKSTADSVTPMKGGGVAGTTHWYPNPKSWNQEFDSRKLDLQSRRPE